jgi:hypothetical protein
MSEMVERVARAIQAAYGDGNEQETHPAALEAARAAIKAMRDPTVTMLAYGMDQTQVHSHIIKAAWKDMIDEALR